MAYREMTVEELSPCSVLTNFPVPTRNRHRVQLLLAANRKPPFGAACRRAVRQGLRFMVRGRVLCGSAPSARSFVPDYDPRQSGYLLLDVRMPQMTRLELQQQLGSTGSGIVPGAKPCALEILLAALA